MSIVNSAAQKPITQNNKLVTIKPNKDFHGYGTKSIERIVAKYDGISQWNYDENEREFRYDILFNK